MKTVATLGPSGTFSGQATEKYLNYELERGEIVFYSSIKMVLNAIGGECNIGVLPIENLSEGFITPVLDHLLYTPLRIVGEIVLPIRFSCVSNAFGRENIRRLYVQYYAKGQCEEFVESLGDVNVVTTNSNIESLLMLKKSDEESAAIVPFNSFDEKDYRFVRDNVNDYLNNKTRFIVITSDSVCLEYNVNLDYKTSVIVLEEKDRPGMLYEILASFTKRGVNLCSLVSRPTCEELGKYHFYIEVEGHVESENVASALNEISNLNRLLFLGSYKKCG